MDAPNLVQGVSGCVKTGRADEHQLAGVQKYEMGMFSMSDKETAKTMVLCSCSSRKAEPRT